MKITIEDDVLEKYGVTLQDFCILLYVSITEKSPSIEPQMLDSKAIIPDVNNPDKVYISAKYREILSNIVLDSDLEVPKVERAEALAVKMMAIYPEGMKEGTSLHWRGNKRDVTSKLRKFFKIYGNYTDEQILEATQRYVNKHENDKKYMRILKYFIWKNEIKRGEDGQYVENISELANYLDNVDSSSTDLVLGTLK